MKMPFRLYRRGKTYYAQNNDTGEQESLRTKDKATANGADEFNACQRGREPDVSLDDARTKQTASTSEQGQFNANAQRRCIQSNAGGLESAAFGEPFA